MQSNRLISLFSLGAGLSIQKVSQPENKHYVFIDLIISNGSFQ